MLVRLQEVVDEGDRAPVTLLGYHGHRGVPPPGRDEDHYTRQVRCAIWVQPPRVT